MWYYVVGDFPEGLAYSDQWETICRVREEFFQEHAPNLCVDKNPPTCDLLGVKSLALPDMLIEIAAEAAI
jgi:enamine deaminase RidA (YjgF/YER057c/UK114 family)